MTKLTFDRAAYSIELKAFREQSVAADGKADRLGASSMAALMLAELSPLALAVSFYDAFAPTNAKGSKVEPKEADNGTIRVRSLEQPHVRGSAGARVLLERVLYCFEQRNVSPVTAAAVEAFAMGDKFTHNGKASRNVTMLQALIKGEKMRLAKEQAGDSDKAEPSDSGDAAIVEAALTDAERLSAALGLLKAITSAPTDATERLVIAALAAELDRIAAIVEVEPIAEAA